MSSKKEGALSNPKFLDEHLELTKASTVIQTYVSFILQQADLKLNALPNLPAHQKTARDHGNNWNNTILPIIFKTDADIIDYANKFDSFYNYLVKYAKDIRNPESKKNLIEGLNLLASAIKEKDKNALDVVNHLATFQKNLQTDSQNLSGDVDQAAEKIEGDKGEIKALSDKLDAIHDAMDKDIGLMVGGALTQAAGIVMIVAGAMSEIPTFGASTGLIGGGVLLVAGGTPLEILGSKDYSSQIDQQRKVQELLARDKRELLGLKIAKRQVEGFVDGVKKAITAATSLKAAWQTLDADLGVLITTIQNFDPDKSKPWLLAQLDNAKQDWKLALDQAKNLQPDGKVPTQLFTNVQDAFKQAKPPKHP